MVRRMPEHGGSNSPMSDEDVRAGLEGLGDWYHTIELRPGIRSRGEFDLRSIPAQLPWIDLRGKRCLDVGSYDGFWAFEMEQRGAAEVVAVDVDDPLLYDWPEVLRPRVPDLISNYRPSPMAGRFQLARAALGSRVDRRSCSIYDLDPEVLGRFDFVMCSSLLVHLRDPLRALAALRGVCAGHLLTNEPIDLQLSLRHPRHPVARFEGLNEWMHWWIPNLAAQERMLASAGFEVVDRSKPLVMPFGTKHVRSRTRSQLRDLAYRLYARSGDQGVLQRAILAKSATR